jgi:hypothetical protein
VRRDDGSVESVESVESGKSPADECEELGHNRELSECAARYGRRAEFAGHHDPC